MKRSEPDVGFKTLVIDTSITHGLDYEIDFSKKQSGLHNLPFIFKGVDSFEVRIWCSSIMTRSDLFILRYTNNKWVAANYIYYENEGIIDSLHLTTTSIAPNKAIQIQEYLSGDSILDLPSQIAIPNFRDNTADGETYYIEIATRKFYKHLRYHNPQYFKDPYNQFFLRLLSFLQSKLNIQTMFLLGRMPFL